MDNVNFQVDSLREELEKEEMYVEYLDKLLQDIELHRHKPGDQEEEEENVGEAEEEGDLDLTVTSGGSDGDKESDRANLRSSLTLDLESSSGKEKHSSFVTVISVKAAEDDGSKEESSQEPEQQPGSKLTFTKSKTAKKSVTEQQPTFNSFGKRAPPPPSLYTKPVPAVRRQESRESLASVSSPLSPTSPVSPLSEHPVLNPREAPASPRSLLNGGQDPETSSESGSPASTGLKSSKSGARSKPEPPARSISIKDSLHQETAKSDSSTEDIDLQSAMRGRPDGGETDESLSLSSLGPASNAASVSAAGKVRDLRANWENKPPISLKPSVSEVRRSKRDTSRDPGPTSMTSPPVARKTRTDSDTSSRGRMGSPSGKSHDSSDDSSSSWGRGSGSPGAARRRQSGETRLDRLVRRPSGEKSFTRQLSEGSSGPPSLPKPKKLVRKWSNSALADETGDKEEVEEPLYDTVPSEEPEDEYDNHLLYGTGTGANKKPVNGVTDTVRYDGLHKFVDFV